METYFFKQKRTSLSHLFLDDFILFVEAFAAQVPVINKVLDIFCLSSGEE